MTYEEAIRRVSDYANTSEANLMKYLEEAGLNQRDRRNDQTYGNRVVRGRD